ncbi:hypothetical protein ACTFIV_006185 [Dictyostelium citrinum]
MESYAQIASKIDTRKILNELSLAVHNTQEPKIKYVFMINIKEEATDKLRDKLQNVINKEKDTLILSKGFFKVLTNSKQTVKKIMNCSESQMKGLHSATIRPKKCFSNFNWKHSINEVKKVLEKNGIEIIKTTLKGNTLKILSFNNISDSPDKNTIIDRKYISIICYENKKKEIKEKTNTESAEETNNTKPEKSQSATTPLKNEETITAEKVDQSQTANTTESADETNNTKPEKSQSATTPPKNEESITAEKVDQSQTANTTENKNSPTSNAVEFLNISAINEFNEESKIVESPSAIEPIDYQENAHYIDVKVDTPAIQAPLSQPPNVQKTESLPQWNREPTTIQNQAVDDSIFLSQDPNYESIYKPRLNNNRVDKTPRKPEFINNGTLKRKTLDQTITETLSIKDLETSNENSSTEQTREDQTEESTIDAIEDKLNKALQRVDPKLPTIRLNIALLSETNIKKNKTTIINNQFTNKLTCHATAITNGQGVSQIIINKQINTATRIINERIITSDWNIAGNNLKCTTLYAPAKQSERLKWFKKNLTTEILNSDIIAGDFNVNNKNNTNKINTFIIETLEEAGLTEIKAEKGVTFPRDDANLDRIFISKKIAHLNPRVNIKKIKEKSDHNMVILKINIPNLTLRKNKKDLWRQNLQATKDHTAADKITKTIEYFSCKFNNLNICSKWLKLKEEIKKQAISNEINIANKQKSKINKTYNKLQKTDKPTRIAFLKDKLAKLLKEEAENKLTNQTNTYINNKETPSKFLTRRLIVMKKKNEIHQLLNNSNKIVTENEEILESARIYYEKLYQKKECNEEIHHHILQSFKRKVDPNILNSIDTPIEEDEIRLCIEKIQEGKAPGKDGLIPTFYKNHLNQIMPFLVNLFNHFLDNEIPTEFKQGIIIIIYKNKGDPNHLDNYRPITLLNVDYKIYSKIINNRIMRFLEEVISPFQAGFVPNRLLHDNIIALNTTIERINREIPNNKNLSPIITFYDFEKAFDSISHMAILRTLAHLKLPFKLITTIMNMLKDSETSLYINNQLSAPFISKRGTKQGDPISPTLFALVVECMATAIIDERTVKGIGKEGIKILQFADDTATIASNFTDHMIMDHIIKKFCLATSAKINKNKCICITFKKDTNTLYEKATNSERYLGFNFNSKGVDSKTDQISAKIKNQLTSWEKITSTYQGRLILSKTYALSQLTFHTYINTTNNNIENSIVKFIFNTKKRNTISESRRVNNYRNGGLNVWNLKIREMAQKVWIYERYRHQIKNKTPSSFNNIWSREENMGMGNINPSAPNFHLSCTTLHKACFTAWSKLSTPSKQPTHYSKLPKLKTIYTDLMKLKYSQFDQFKPTPGQQDILSAINKKHLPFYEIKKITNIKGRDILWRYALKALPKVFNKPCALCGEGETSEHIFFKCKSHLEHTQKIFNYILTKSGNREIKWDIKVLNHLEIEANANLIAILMEAIWKRRNKFIHEKVTIKIHKELIIHELKKTQMAVWEKTKSNIEKRIRIMNKDLEDNEHKHIQIISKSLQKYSKQWNSPLLKTRLPEHLKQFITSINTLYE